MAYPFANNQYAQSSSQGHRGGYNSSYDHGYPSQFGTTAGNAQYHQDSAAAEEPPADYGYEPSMIGRDEQQQQQQQQQHATYGNYGHDDYTQRQQQPYGQQDSDEAPPPPVIEKDAKIYNEGRSPYAMAPEMAGVSPYTGKSIWTRDDKRVMAKRGVPARIFRVLFCTVIHVIIIILSVVSLVVIFARPPNVGIGQIVTPDASSVGVSGSALTLNGSVEFIISNPNSISATLTHLNANIYDVVDTSQAVGTGVIKDEKIEAKSNTTVTFPYQIRYDPDEDENKTILRDLANKCGISGGTASDLDLTLKVSASISILSVPIPFSFSQPISFVCPLTAATLKSLGLDSILGLFDGVNSKRSVTHGSNMHEL